MFPFRSFSGSNSLFYFLQIVVCQPFTVKFLGHAFFVHIIIVGLVIPDCIRNFGTTVNINDKKSFIRFLCGSNRFRIPHHLFDKRTVFCFFWNIRLLFRFDLLRSHITLLRNQRINTGSNLCPGKLYFIAAVFRVANPLCIVIFSAAGSTGKSMRVTARAILVFQKVRFFFCRMSFLPVFIDAGFSTGNTTAAGKGRIDFIIGDKLAYNWRYRHSALIFSE